MPNYEEVIFSSSNKAASKKVQTHLKAGLLKEIAPRIYTSNLTDDPAKIVLRNWFIILSYLYPDSILSHRSAIEIRPTKGHIYLTYTYTKNVSLPGLMVHLLKGPDKEHGAARFFEKLYRSTEARALLENMQQTRSTAKFSKTLSQEMMESKLEAVIRTRGENELNKIRDEARGLGSVIKMEKEFGRLNKLISAMLSTQPSRIINSEVGKARAYGEPFDQERIALFDHLFDFLSRQEIKNYKDSSSSDKSYNCFAFFESYFSNFIEGTEFAVKEAEWIITTEIPLPTREEDSHDILGTYRIVSDKQEMGILPSSPEHLLLILRSRHEILLRARIAKKPGQFKDLNNRTGNTEFVDWQLVTGTLKKGFQFYSLLQDPFAKACYIMFLISEVHPFLDGNGRVARVMMNAELTAKGMSKIIIPTVYRSDYLGAIRKLTRKGEPETYFRMLHRAYRFSATVHGEDMDEVEDYLKRCNAFESGEEYILRF